MGTTESHLIAPELKNPRSAIRLSSSDAASSAAGSRWRIKKDRERLNAQKATRTGALPAQAEQ
ncbi:hypothetical protein [Sinorhizobium sp. BG8]|uniref:hypothetical protein n=1 Tax=Sinorhizobium sp. BG8 TaxID=2613773 RepID=UPI00193E21A8|nr:hypothetical protein [Sinorhizobium sp. BG8]QRM55005.1 hypothetical protein F3Y30_10985 [Sinorhizobium sp. BG8]